AAAQPEGASGQGDLPPRGSPSPLRLRHGTDGGGAACRHPGDGDDHRSDADGGRAAARQGQDGAVTRQTEHAENAPRSALRPGKQPYGWAWLLSLGLHFSLFGVIIGAAMLDACGAPEPETT